MANIERHTVYRRRLQLDATMDKLLETRQSSSNGIVSNNSEGGGEGEYKIRYIHRKGEVKFLIKAEKLHERFLPEGTWPTAIQSVAILKK